MTKRAANPLPEDRLPRGWKAPPSSYYPTYIVTAGREWAEQELERGGGDAEIARGLLVSIGAYEQRLRSLKGTLSEQESEELNLLLVAFSMLHQYALAYPHLRARWKKRERTRDQRERETEQRACRDAQIAKMAHLLERQRGLSDRDLTGVVTEHAKHHPDWPQSRKQLRAILRVEKVIA